jgi:pilus assembly protein CpaE
MLSVLLVGRSKASLQNLSKQFNERTDCVVEVRAINNGHIDPLHQLKTDPDIVFVRLSKQHWRQELDALEQRSSSEGPEIVIVGEPNNGTAIRQAMRAGAKDYLSYPVDDAELDETMKRITRDLYGSRSAQAAISAFINGGGGAGGSFLACNVAHIMAAASNLRVTLIDLDLMFGNVAQYFDLETKRDLRQALEEVDHLDSIALDAYTVKHRSGLRILSAVDGSTGLFTDAPSDGLYSLLELLSGQCDQIIVDLPRHIDVLSAVALEKAENIILVIQQSLSHVRSASRLLNILRLELGIPEERIIVVVNRFQKSAAVTQVDVEQTLNRKELIVIPNDYQNVIDSINAGIPMYEHSKGSRIATALMSLETRLGGYSQDVTQGRFARTVASILGT